MLRDWRKWPGPELPTNNAPLREGKGRIYEGGIRVPLIVRWPGRILAGSTSDAVVGPIDLYPTLLDAAGLPQPAGHRLDGRSLLPLLEQTGTLDRAAYFTWFPHLVPGVSVRHGDWKLIRRFEWHPDCPDPRELYNLKDDLGETTNLAARLLDKVRELDALLGSSVRPGIRLDLRRPPNWHVLDFTTGCSMNRPKIISGSGARCTGKPRGQRPAASRSAVVLVAAFVGVAVPAGAAPLNLAPLGLECTLVVRHGTAREPFAAVWSEDHGVYEARAENLRIGVGPLVEGILAVIPVRVTNDRDEQALVELQLVHRAVVDPETAAWWDGWHRVTEPIAGRQRIPFENTPTQGHLPVAALAAGAQAVVLGRAPEPLGSYFVPTLDYATDGTVEFRYALRLVLAAGQRDEAAFVAGVVAGADFDLRAAAWQAYMDAFPRYFRPRPGISPTLRGASIQYQSWNRPPELEVFRRLRTTWEWCYAPFKRAGDMWGRAEEWDYTPLKGSWEGRQYAWLGGAELGGLSAEEFRKRRAAYFAAWGYDCGHLFYSPAGAWVEKQLAESLFPDAIVENPAYQTEKGPWVTHWDREVLVQSQGTSYWPRLQEDLRLVTERLDVCGFAFDVFYGINNYGPGARLPLPGRAWDDRGIYIDIGLGMIEQAEFIRSLDTSGKPFETMAVVGGVGQCAFFADAGLLELTLYGPARESYPLMRMALGSKPAVMWKGWDLPSLLPDLATMERREFLEQFSRIADYVRLKSFQWGIFPTYPYLVGIESMQRDMPLLVELVGDGWQPLAPAVVKTCDNHELWLSRYGTGPQSTLVIGSPHEQDLDAEVTCMALPGCTGALAYVNWRDPATALAQRMAGGTNMQLVLPAREATVLRPVLSILGSASLECTARVDRQLSAATVTVNLTVSEPAAVTLQPSSLPGYHAFTAVLNGEKLPSSGAVTLRAGENVVQVIHNSAVFRLSQAELNGFPFTDGAGEINFAFVVAEPEGRVARRIVRRVQDFFSRWAAANDKEAGTLAVFTPENRPAGPAIMVRFSPQESAGWTAGPEPETLLLTIASESEAVEMTLAMLEALETRYPWVVPFKPYAGIHARFGMLNKTLNQVMREEGLPCGR